MPFVPRFKKVLKIIPLLPIVLGLTAGGGAPTAAPSHPMLHYKGVLLQKIIGGIAKVRPIDKVEDCKIESDHPGVKGRLEELGKLVDAASGKDFNTAYHFMAQVPSIEIFATRVYEKEGHLQTDKVLLLQDYETLKTRIGPEAQTLIDLTNKLCPTPRPH